MKTLKSKTKTFEEVDWRDFDLFVSGIIGREFEFAAEEESPNDTAHAFSGVRRVPDFNSYKPDTPPEKIRGWFDSEMLEAQEWIDNRGPYCGTRSLLQWLCVKRHVEPGNYLIQVSW